MKLADCEPEQSPYSTNSWAARRPPSIAMARAKLRIEAQAKRCLRGAIKDRAWAYARHPRDMDAISEDLSSLPPKILVCALEIIIEHKTRWFGFGGEVSAINLRGATLYARWARRVANRRK